MENKYQGVREYIDKCFENVLITKEVKEVKAELVFNLENKIADYMKNEMDFQTAYNKAVDSLGNMEELISEFEMASEIEETGNNDVDGRSNGKNTESHQITNGKQSQNKFEDSSDDKYTYKYNYKYDYDYEYKYPKDKKTEKDYNFNPAMFVPLSVFLYVGLGLITNWDWWWVCGWAIIPVTAILAGGRIIYLKTGKKNPYTIVALMPFVYVILGLITGWDLWWVTGWIIIPVSAILVLGFHKKKE